MNIPLTGIQAIDDLRKAKFEALQQPRISPLEQAINQEKKRLKEKLRRRYNQSDRLREENKMIETDCIPRVEELVKVQYAAMSD